MKKVDISSSLYSSNESYTVPFLCNSLYFSLSIISCSSSTFSLLLSSELPFELCEESSSWRKFFLSKSLNLKFRFELFDKQILFLIEREISFNCNIFLLDNWLTLNNSSLSLSLCILTEEYLLEDKFIFFW